MLSTVQNMPLHRLWPERLIQNRHITVVFHTTFEIQHTYPSLLQNVVAVPIKLHSVQLNNTCNMRIGFLLTFHTFSFSLFRGPTESRESMKGFQKITSQKISDTLKMFLNSLKNSDYSLKDIISKFFRFPASSYFRKPLQTFTIKNFFLI